VGEKGVGFSYRPAPARRTDTATASPLDKRGYSYSRNGINHFLKVSLRLGDENDIVTLLNQM
jgi:hypothetical protein